MTTVSPWRARQPLVFFFSSFTKQIDQIARPEAAAAAKKFPRDLTGGGGGGGHSALWTPRQHTPCLLGYRFSFEKHFHFYRRTYIKRI